MEVRQPNDPQSSSGFPVSGRQQNTYYSEVNDKLEEFVKCFVEEFEAKLLAYYLFLNGAKQKAGKISDTLSETLGQVFGGATGALIGFLIGLPKEGAKAGAKAGEKAGKKVGNILGNTYHRKEVTKLLDLIAFFQDDKYNLRRVVVEAGFDVFQSFEMQFMRVTTNGQGPGTAIMHLAKDASNRAISHMKENKEISISESVILGISKKQKLNSVSSGYTIQYEYQSNRKDWNTASLFNKVGIVIEDQTSKYYKKKQGESKTTKYGYRRLLLKENWDKLKEKYDSDDTVESNSVQFTDYQYIVTPKCLEEQITHILGKLNSNDPNLGKEGIEKILEEVRNDILLEMNVLKEQFHKFIDEDSKKLSSIEDSIKNFGIDEYLKKFEQYFEEGQQERQSIAHSIEEGREENRIGISGIQKGLGEIKAMISPKQPQETQTESIISGLGITKYYYMSRTLNRHIQIRDDFKKEKNKFFVTRSNQTDNSKLKKNQNIVIISNTSIDFKKLCEEYKNYNIHWLKEIESKLIWQYSQGSLSELRKFIINKKVPISDVNKISDIEDKVVIISAGPGMGKSTLLTHLAAEQNEFSSTLKVIRVNLKDHTDKLSGPDFENENKTIDFLKEVTKITVLDLKNTILLFDGFDEISSNTDYKDKVIKLIRFFKNKAKNVWVTTRPYAQYDLEDKLSVFSYTLEPLSPVTQKEFLEKFWKINIVYDMIKEFTLKIDSEIEDAKIKSLASKVSKLIELQIGELKDNDNLKQIKDLSSEFMLSEKENIVKKITAFIDKQLGKQHIVSKKVKDMVDMVNDDPNLEEIRDLIEKRAKMYSEELIVKFSNSVSDKEREFTGVPLQVRMLAEAFEEEFYEDLKKCYALPPNQRALNIPKLPTRLNLLNLYERFIENKHRINFVEKGNMDLTNEFNKNLCNENREPFMDEHRLLALSFFFAENDWEKIMSKEEIDKIEKLKEDIGLGKKNTGIVYQIINNKPHFIHLTFAEYFVADFFVDMLKRTKDSLKNEQLRDILGEYIFKTENAVLRNFFDRMLAKDKECQNQYEIHTAVLNNDIHMIKNILSDSQEAKLIINSLDKGERTALHLAAAYGYLDIVKVLLEQHVGINTKDQIFAWSPLSYADKNSYWDIAELLLQNNASFEDMFEAKKNVNTCYKGKRTLLHIAAQEGYIEFAKVLVEKLEANCRAADNYDNIPLHLAAEYGELEIVKYLLNKDIETARSKNYSGKTPLELAVYRGQLDVVEYLGEKLDLGTTELNEMKLNAAAYNGDYNMVKMLLKENVDVDSKILGWTPLHQAALDGHLNVVKLLVQNGSEIVHPGDDHPNPNIGDGWTPLHGAANNGRYDIVKYLVKELLKKGAGADINPANKEGYTPLHTAARGGHLSVVKYFIEELGENKVYINISDKKGTTPLHAAAFHGKYNIVQYLVGQDANINAIDSWGATVVFSAACYNDHNIINFLMERNAIIDASEGVIGRLGITVLHVAAMYGASEIVKSLVEEKKIDVNAEKNSFTPLHLAVLSDSFSTIKYLINKGAKVNAVVNFSNIAKILKDEENVFKDTSMNTIVQKLIKFCSYLDYMVNLTPCDIYKLLKFNNKETLELLEQKDRGLLYDCCYAIKNFAGSFIRENYLKEQINELKVFISEKKSGDLYLLEQHFLDPPQESHL